MSCDCSAGGEGTQTCRADGSGFGVCAPCNTGGSTGGGGETGGGGGETGGGGGETGGGGGETGGGGGETGGGGGETGGGAGTGGGDAGTARTCLSPDAPVCGVNGQCVDEASGPRCACVAPYTGPTCAACLPGHQDHDGDGVCAPDCATANLTCGAREQCDDASGLAQCTCSVGFVAPADGGSACEWAPTPRDPGLNTSEPGWTATGLTWTPLAPGHLNVGLASWTAMQLCDPAARMSQQVTLPPAPFSEPLALSVTLRRSAAQFPLSDFFLVRLGRDTRSLYLEDLWATRRVCLGEGALGTSELQLLPSLCSSSVSWAVDVDDVRIAPAANCPAPGQLTNGDFEADAGWTRFAGTGGTAAITGVLDGGQGLRLTVANQCSLASASNTMSVPLAATLPNPALRFEVRGSGVTPLSLLVDDEVIARVRGTGHRETQTVCLPDWLHGRAGRLGLQLSWEGSAVCATATPTSFELDGLTLVSAPECHDAPLDPGFERASLDGPWLATGTASVVADAGAAHGGEHFASLSINSPCLATSVTQTVRIPEPVGVAGPALRFWFRRPTAGNTAARLDLTVGQSPWRSVSVNTSATWAQRTICLPASHYGASLTVSFTAVGAGGTCANTFPPVRFDVDDVEVTADVTCPP